MCAEVVFKNTDYIDNYFHWSKEMDEDLKQTAYPLENVATENL